MIVHSVRAIPETYRVSTVGKDIAVEDPDPRAVASNGELVLGSVVNRTVIVVDGEVGDGDVRCGRIDIDDGGPPVTPVLLNPLLAKLGVDNRRTVPVFADEGNKALFDKDLFVIDPFLNKDDHILGIVLRDGIKGSLDCPEGAGPVCCDDDLCALGARNPRCTRYEEQENGESYA